MIDLTDKEWSKVKTKKIKLTFVDIFDYCKYIQISLISNVPVPLVHISVMAHQSMMIYSVTAVIYLHCVVNAGKYK